MPLSVGAGGAAGACAGARGGRLLSAVCPDGAQPSFTECLRRRNPALPCGVLTLFIFDILKYNLK